MSSISYQTGVPNPPDDPSQDVSIMQSNCDSINQIIAVDHIGFNVLKSGYHNIIRQPPQLVDPGLLAGIGQIYTKTMSGDQQLFYESGGGVVSQLTGLASSFVATGYSKLPGGLIIQWGGGTVKASGTPTPFSFPIAFTTLFSITIGSRTGEGNSPGSNNQFIKEGSQSITGFSIVNSSSSSSRAIYYIAVGN